MIWKKNKNEKDDDDSQISNKSKNIIEENYGDTLVKTRFES
jgi:hypothetical protein